MMKLIVSSHTEDTHISIHLLTARLSGFPSPLSCLTEFQYFFVSALACPLLSLLSLGISYYHILLQSDPL